MSKVGSASHKLDDEVSSELVGKYGSTLVIMTSNPEELDIACKKLGKEYRVVMETTVMDNNDYVKVLVRKDAEKICI